TVAIGLLWVLPHLVALRTNSGAIAYAEAFAATATGIGGRFYNIGYVIFGALLFLLPAWLVIAGGLVNGNCRFTGMPRDPDTRNAARFIITLTAVAVALTFALALATGAVLNHRYGAPYFGLFLLSAAPLVGFRAETFAA